MEIQEYKERQAITFTNEQIELVKTQIAKNATDDELKLFLNQCKRTQLDPFTRQIYFMKRENKKTGKSEMTVMASIDGLRLIAERSDKYQGQDGPYWCGPDGVWRDVWISKEPPVAAKVGVFKKEFRQALFGIALWDEYVQKYYNKEKAKWCLSPLWEKMPSLMIAKTAEALALRKAFPNDLSGIYTGEEIQTEVEPEQSKEPEQPKEEPKVEVLPPVESKPKVWKPSNNDLTRAQGLCSAQGYSEEEVCEILNHNFKKHFFIDLTKEEFVKAIEWFKANNRHTLK